MAMLLLCAAGNAQRPEDWSYPLADDLPGSTRQFEYAADSTLWIATREALIENDGVNSISHLIPPLTDSNGREFEWEFSAGPDGKFYYSIGNNIFSFDPATDAWENLAFPSGASVSGLAFDAAGTLWVITQYRIAYLDASGWVTNMRIPDIRSFRGILIDDEDTKWIISSSSTCFDIACFNPAKVARITTTDTIVFGPADFNVLEPQVIDADLTDEGEIRVSVYDQIDLRTTIFRYVDGSWETVTELPVDKYHSNFYAGKKSLLLSRDLMTFEYRDGAWRSYLADSTRLLNLAYLAMSPDTNLVVGGSVGNSQVASPIIAILEKQPYAISGRVSLDFNENGVLDGREYYLSDRVVRSDDGNVAFTDAEGRYRLPYSVADTYAVSVDSVASLTFAQPGTGTQNPTVNDVAPTAADVDFSFTTDTTKADFTVALTPGFAFRPGFGVSYQMRVTNLGYVSARTQVQCRFDSSLLAPVLPPGSVNLGNNAFTFDFDPLAFRETEARSIGFTLPATTPLGVTLVAACQVQPLDATIDTDPTNDQDTAYVITRGAYDPNDITVSPAGDNAEGRVPVATSKLEYTIRFQNVGTDTAFTVVVSNPIEADLDMTTLKVLDYSHDYNINWFPGRGTVNFNFPDIQLVDSITNEAGSNGFIRYTIDLTAPAAGVVVNNDAGIYFDYNEPVLTNTTITTLMDRPVSATNLPTFAECEASFTQFGDVARWNFPRQPYELSVVDVNGRVIARQTGVGDRVETALTSTQPGLYFISVYLKACGRKVTEKVFQH